MTSVRRFGSAIAVALCAVLLLGFPLGSGARPSGASSPHGEAAVSSAPPDFGPLAPLNGTTPGFDLPGAEATGALSGGPLPILVTFAYADPAGLGTLLVELQQSSSPEFGQYLTQAEFDREFGGSSEAYQAAIDYFASYGVEHVTTYADRASLTFDATPAEIDAAFHTRLGRFVQDTRSYFAPESEPELPAELASHVVGVQGLSNYSTLRIPVGVGAAGLAGPSGAGAPSSPGVAPLSSVNSTPCRSSSGPFHCTTVSNLSFPQPVGLLTSTGVVQGIFPSDLQVTYDEINAKGTGVLQRYGAPVGGSLATLLWSDPVNTSRSFGAFCHGLTNGTYASDFYAPDVFNFYNYTLPAGEPKPHPYSVPITGAASYARGKGGRSASCDSDGRVNLENTLDVDMAGSLAPGANIYQVFGQGNAPVTTDTDFADVLNPSASDGPGFTPAVVRGLENLSVISNSFDGNATTNDTGWYQDLEEAEARGISVLAGAGDTGQGTVQDPAGQSYDAFGDVAVGGTDLSVNGTTLLRTNETAWSGDTGGTSTLFPQPDWQTGSKDASSVIASGGGGRGVPDIAAIANNTLISLTSGGVLNNVTSAGTGSTPGPAVVDGTSIASPAEAAILLVIDHALYATHHLRLGFPDPLIYLWGQEEFSGTLRSSPFYDVTFGRNANFTAASGYDLVTGWGPIDATVLARLLLALDLRWENITLAPLPPARQGTSMAYDQKDGYTVLFGGYSNGTASLSYHVYNDTWKFQNGVWTNITRPAAPEPRFGASMAYDAKDGYLILFGGENICLSNPPPQCIDSDTWKFVGGNWTNITPAKSPAARFAAGMTYDDRDKAVVLFGGEIDIAKAPYYRLYADTWEFAGGKWTNVTPATGPPARRAMGFTYDAKNGYVVLFGGEGGTTHPTFGDTWTFVAGTWTNISSSGSPSPRASWGLMAYDPFDGYVVLFGGCIKSCTFVGDYVNETWKFVGGKWTNITSARSPEARLSTLVYDTKDRYLVLYSGYGVRTNGSPGYLPSTWIFS